MRRAALKVLIVFALLYVGILGWLSVNQRSLIYYPDKNIKPVAEYNLPDVQDITLTKASGGNVQAWMYKNEKSNLPMVLYLHGNSYTLGFRSTRFRELIDAGYSFFAPSYDGFGHSDGSPSYDSIMETANLAVEYLKQQGYETEKLLVIGESLGSGVSVTLANQHQFGGLMLITPYTSIADRAQEMYWFLPVRHLLHDNFNSAELISNINAPVMMVHGTRDSVIPHTHSEKLMTIANEPKKLIIYEGKGHTNFDDREVFKEMTKYFIEEGRLGAVNNNSEQF